MGLACGVSRIGCWAADRKRVVAFGQAGSSSVTSSVQRRSRHSTGFGTLLVAFWPARMPHSAMQDDAAEPAARLAPGAGSAPLHQVDPSSSDPEQQPNQRQHQAAPPPPVPPLPAGDEQQQHVEGLPARAGTPSNAFHALEIQSDGRSEDGSYYEHQLLAKGATSAAVQHGGLEPPPHRRPPPGSVLPGGLSKRQRLVMVCLFSLTAGGDGWGCVNGGGGSSLPPLPGLAALRCAAPHSAARPSRRVPGCTQAPAFRPAPTAALLYADQNLMAPNLSAIATGARHGPAARASSTGQQAGYLLAPPPPPAAAAASAPPHGVQQHSCAPALLPVALPQTLALTTASATACWGVSSPPPSTWWAPPRRCSLAGCPITSTASGCCLRR